MNDKKTWIEANIERAVMRVLGFGCAIPAGIYAEYMGNRIRLLCQIIRDGREYRVDEFLNPRTAIEEAVEIAKDLKEEVQKHSQ